MTSAPLRLLRPKQWSKGVLVFAAPLFTRRLGDGQAMGRELLAFIAIALLSSAIYVLNDAMDLERDRRHPVKRRRPLASGEVRPRLAAWLGCGCAAAGLGLGVALGSEAITILVVYALLQLAYNFALKAVPVADVFLLASGYVLRAALGAVTIQVAMSGWLLFCTGALALMVGIGKRRSEYSLQVDSGIETREALSGYTLAGLDVLLAIAASMATLSYGVYSLQSDTAKENPGLTLTAIWVVYAVFRYAYLCVVRQEGAEPETLLFKDRHLLVAAGLFVVTAALAMAGRLDPILGPK